jgi:signal transduction histidine kinase
MSVVYRLRLRKVARVIRVRSNERLVQRTLIAREFYDTLLQTVEACKFVIDDALEKSNDTHMRRALEQLSNWLGQATQEGQKALHSLSTANVEKHDD